MHMRLLLALAPLPLLMLAQAGSLQLQPWARQ
jgi:hypothetical protein